VNVAVCREEEFKITKSEHPDRVAVVGGGPAGMEAARVCALRGHEVTLYEKRKLGGALVEASIPEFKIDLRPLISYFVTQMDKLKINVITEEATAQSILDGGFDVVIVATGAAPMKPDIPGIDSAIVTDALQVLRGSAKTGEKVAVIGAGLVGTEVGLFLGEQGKEVIFIEMMDTIMNGIVFDEKQVYENRLNECKVSFHTGQRLESISANKMVLIDKFGARSEMTADTIVLASGFRPNRDLIDQLKSDSDQKVLEVGDCMSPRKIFDAIHEGHLAAKLLN
jgi:pyruvate/2-oxoglutarate dehydrogenase complex dihydrolipoamide dehydrogenase (E3) component